MRQATSLTLPLIVLALFHPDHNLSFARSIPAVSWSRFNANGYQDKEASDHDHRAVLNPHVRQKRGLFSVFSKGLTAASWGAYGASMGVSVYYAIRKCEDHRPKPCIYPTCKFLSPCPNNLCQSPEKNLAYVNEEKEEMKKQLNKIDALLLDAYNLEVDGKGALISNERILNYINSINTDVDRFASGIVELDGRLSEKFKNKSLAIQAMVIDKRTTLDQIVSSPTMQGIFDKWTWDGTGRFVFSVALTVGYVIYTPLKERYAINKIYNEMTADFKNKFQNQGVAANPNGLSRPKLHNKFAYVQGLTTAEIKAQIKSAATAVHKSNQASKTQGLVSKAIGPVMNGLYTALSAWSIYQHVKKCEKITNDMQDTALNVTYTRDEIKEIKVTEVEPLLNDVYNQNWKPVKDLLTNETILDLLEGIKNLTLAANFTDTSLADTIQYFIANIVMASSTKSVLALQNRLITALDKIQFQFKCLANKQHAIAVVINDCKSGRDTLQVLHTEAESMYDLNTQSCVEKKVVPYTSVKQLQTITFAIATEKGWYDNCLLNNNDLLYRVCSEKMKGYVKPADIVAQVKKSALTEDMVSNFVTRCPPPSITPKIRADTCKYYCRYETTQEIAKLFGLLESQVNEITPSCGICSVSDGDKTKICSLHFCKGVYASIIETEVELPLPTVNDVISKCVQKCVLSEAEKQEVCEQSKCKQYESKKISSSLNLPLASIDQLKAQCDNIVTKCMISERDKRFILFLACLYKAPPSKIQESVKLPLQDIERVIQSQNCTDYLQMVSKS